MITITAIGPDRRSTTITPADVISAIMRWPGLYETEAGARFMGMPVSQLPKHLVECGWRKVSRLDEFDLKNIGVSVVTARYVGGVHPKRFCRVVIAKENER